MHEKMEKVNGILEKDLEKKLDQVIAAGTINPEDVKVMKDAVKLMLKFKEYEEWEMNAGGMSHGYSYGYSTRRGRNQTTGRYMSYDNDPYMNNQSYGAMPYMNGYSGHGLIEKIEELYPMATTEQERRTIREMIDRLNMSR